MKEIKYPYLPQGQRIYYVSERNGFMQAAKNLCDTSGCIKQPTGAVIVKGSKIIGRGSNAGKRVEECPRWGSPTGTNYGPCKDVCQQEGHAEVMAIKDAEAKDKDTHEADLYLYGHWWCCENCWNHILAAGIKRVILLEKSEELFNPEINQEMKNWGKPSRQ